MSFDVFLASNDPRRLSVLEDEVADECLTFLRVPLRSDWTGLVTLRPLAAVVDLRTDTDAALGTLEALHRLKVSLLALAGDRRSSDKARDLGVATLLEPFHTGDVIAVLMDLVTAEARRRASSPGPDLLLDQEDALDIWDSQARA